MARGTPLDTAIEERSVRLPAEAAARSRALRRFGFTLAAAFGVLGGISLWRGSGRELPLFAVAGVFLLSGLAFPAILAPVHRAWMAIGLVLGWVMTRVILGILFYLVFTPMGLLMRALGKRPLAMRYDRKASSYWIPRPSRPWDPSRYRKQY